MKDSLKPGMTFELEYRVPENKTVSFLFPEMPEGELMPGVFAKGFMVGLFEDDLKFRRWTLGSSRYCIQDFHCSPYRRPLDLRARSHSTRYRRYGIHGRGVCRSHRILQQLHFYYRLHRCLSRLFPQVTS